MGKRENSLSGDFLSIGLNIRFGRVQFHWTAGLANN